LFYYTQIFPISRVQFLGVIIGGYTRIISLGRRPSDTATLKLGIEERLKQEIPAIKEVVSVA